jgi:Zn finger protein HypA/HybF involved in hydrogenase expression
MKDYKVTCNNCGAEYTPKAHTRPENCYNCGGVNIEVKGIGVSHNGP